MLSKYKGFTLIEITIVCVIVGLLLAGVLKGQSMIQNSRAHSIMKLQSETQAAFNAFQDRYRALPGDYAAASTSLPCGSAPCLNGNGNGRVEQTATGGVVHEDILVWTHLTAGNFLTGQYTYDGVSSSNETNTQVNPYGSYMSVSYDNVYGHNSASIRHNIKLGNMIPAAVLLEVDRKIDDGNPYSGNFQFSTYTGTDLAPDAAKCLSGNAWNADSETNCGAVWLM